MIKTTIYRNNLKNWEFGKKAPQNCDSERATIADRQGVSENRNFEEKPTPPKTNSSGYFGISLIICSLCINGIFCNEVIQQLDEKMQKNDSLLCVGLDPDMSKMPLSIQEGDLSVEEKVFLFLSHIVEITAPHVCAYKIQKAFFDPLEGGHTLLKKICVYIHEHYPRTPVFVDCKIGDTDNTMQAYMDNLFGKIGADGVVVNPYMGDDVFEPFLQDPQKVGIVLIQTSNPKAAAVQELQLADGNKLWEKILYLTLTRWNVNKNLILVLSSNSLTQNYIRIRNLIPQTTPILLAGIGAQGGNPQILQHLLNRDRRGVFVNSSRGILYPYQQGDLNWKAEVLRATLRLKKELNQIRYGVMSE